MKKISLYLLLLCNIPVFGHTFAVYDARVGQVYFGGACYDETQALEYAIADICNEYIKRSYPDFKYKVLLSASHEEWFDNRLGLDTIGFNRYNIPSEEIVLELYITSQSSLTLNTLKLLDYAINHIEVLKKTMLQYYSNNNDQKSISPSIPLSEIDSLKQTIPTERIKRFSEIKVKRTLQCQVEYNPDLYFIKNDTFNFYHKCFLKKIIFLRLPVVEQVFGNSEMGYLVFVEKTSFYYLSENENKVVGPVKIENDIEGTPYALDSIDSENMRFELSYTPYKRSLEKIQIRYNIKTNECEQELISRKLPEQPAWLLRLNESLEKAKERENEEIKNN